MRNAILLHGVFELCINMSMYAPGISAKYTSVYLSI